MLIRFSFENFLSYNKKQEFSMLSGRSTRLKHHIIEKDKVSILKTAVMYGANASGKSNFIKALDFTKEVITEGVDKMVIYQKHFRLEANKVNEISSFEVEIKIGASVYAYGFDIILKTKEIKEEWLFEVNKSKDKPIFERRAGKIQLSLSFSNKREENRINYIGFDTKSNQLFLTELCHRNVRSIETLAPLFKVYDWFENDLITIYPSSKYHGIGLFGDSETLTKGFCKFLKVFDTGIEDIEVKNEESENVFRGMPEELRNSILKDLQEIKPDERIGLLFGNDFYSISKNSKGEVNFSKLMTKHIGKNGEKILFELGDESDGTQRMFDLIPALIALAITNKTFIIDELERSLHPNLTKKIIDLYLKNSSNKKSQLIVTTHESSLLDFKFLRRDEIWLVDKNKFGESILTSVEEFHPRHDTEIRKGYLKGRFGGIPKIDDLEKFEWLQN